MHVFGIGSSRCGFLSTSDFMTVWQVCDTLLFLHQIKVQWVLKLHVCDHVGCCGMLYAKQPLKFKTRCGGFALEKLSQGIHCFLHWLQRSTQALRWEHRWSCCNCQVAHHTLHSVYQAVPRTMAVSQHTFDCEFQRCRIGIREKDKVVQLLSSNQLLLFLFVVHANSSVTKYLVTTWC